VGFINVPGIYSEAQTEGWKLVTKTCTKGRMILHNCGIQVVCRILIIMVNASRTVSVESFLSSVYQKFCRYEVVPKEMTIEDIKQTVLDFKTAQKNAIAAGFDGELPTDICCNSFLMLTIVRMNTEVQLKINPESYLRF
jgi:N-ethylmaleimide reductase